MADKFSAVWVSHSSSSDFLKCPRAYFLNNIYRNPSTNHKITIMSPPLALGQAVHEVVESLSVMPTEQRFIRPLTEKLEKAWGKVTGKKGGFKNESQEREYRQKAVEMLKKVEQNPGPLANLAVKIKKDLPYFWLSEEDNIILCGKIDWLEYFPDTDSVKILDFKTGKTRENPGSLQLPIYLLLAENCQNRDVSGASYWYLLHDDKPEEVELPDSDEAYEQVLKIAKKIVLARKLEKFSCPDKGCFHCTPFERVVRGEAELVGTNEYNQDIYVIESADESEESVIL